jgi:hypothetical protein
VRKPGAPVTYQDAAIGFSLATPANWLVFPMDDREEKGSPFVLALNPEGDATVLAIVGKKSDLKPEAQKSLRAWADQKIAAGDKIFANLKVRPDSWKERTVAGNPALSLVGDFAEGKDKRVISAVLTFGKTNAAMLVLKTLEKDFDALQPDFEAIVDSYKGK